jgi:predicted transcriptional regulator
MEVLSIRLDSGMKSRLDALARSSKRSRSVLAAQAIAEYLEAQEWQLGAIGEGIADADAGRTVNPEKVAFWLRSWGKPRERKAPL